MSKSKPWSIKKASCVFPKINREARRAAKRLGASHILIIAHFDDRGDRKCFQVLEGGTTPDDRAETYRQLLAAKYSKQETLPASTNGVAC
jgi:hypothetical protein